VKARPYLESEVRDHHKRFMAGEALKSILKPANRSNGAFYDKIKKYGLPTKSQSIGATSPVKRKSIAMPLEIPINRQTERMALIIGTPTELSKFVGELWK